MALALANAQLLRRFGNLTATNTAEVLVFGRTYAAPASQAQRSVKSTSANDTAAGSGAKTVRITYLTSAYVLKTEDITMNGTTAVNTVNTDIRFIESMEVLSGAAAAGAITLQTTTGGGGTEIMGIAAATTQTMACHHYVPAGKTCYIRRWGASVDDECAFKLLSQARPDGTNLIDRTTDVEKLFGIASPPGRITFEREFIGGSGSPEGIVVPEQSYVRVTVVPNQATSTVIRAFMDLWEV